MNPIRDRAPRRGSRRSTTGATFAEVMLSAAIIGTTVVGAMSSLQSTAEVYHYFADGPHEALMLAQEIHEAAVLLPWEEDPEIAGFGDDVDTFFDLHEETFKPPRSAEYEAIVSHAKWRQSVEVVHVDLADPSVVIENPESFSGDMLVELQVTIHTETNAEMGTFSWWMTEPEDDG